MTESTKPTKYAYLTLVFARDRGGDLYFRSPPGLGWRATLFVMPRGVARLKEIRSPTEKDYGDWKSAFLSAHADPVDAALLWAPESLTFPWVEEELVRLRRSHASTDRKRLRELLATYSDGRPPGFKHQRRWRRAIPLNNAVYRIYITECFERSRTRPKAESLLHLLKADEQWRNHALNHGNVPARPTVYEIIKHYDNYFENWGGPLPTDTKNIKRALSGLEQLFGAMPKTRAMPS